MHWRCPERSWRKKLEREIDKFVSNKKQGKTKPSGVHQIVVASEKNLFANLLVSSMFEEQIHDLQAPGEVRLAKRGPQQLNNNPLLLLAATTTTIWYPLKLWSRLRMFLWFQLHIHSLLLLPLVPRRSLTTLPPTLTTTTTVSPASPVKPLAERRHFRSYLKSRIVKSGN